MADLPTNTIPKSGAIRVVSNYVRLFSSLIIGLILVRLLLRFGNEAFGLIALLGSQTGFAMMLNEIVRASIVPHLGAAYHSENSEEFVEVYNSSILVSLCAAVAAVAALGVIACILPWLNIPETLRGAAYVFIAASAVRCFFTVALAPTFNHYLVTERMVSLNVWLVLERSTDLASAVLACWMFDKTQASQAIITYGICWAALSVSLLTAASLWILQIDNRLWPNPALATRRAAISFLQSVGWNAGVRVAVSLYTRLDMLIMNLWFGIWGNVVFGIASQLAGYVRQTMMGLVLGVDAVASRLATRAGTKAILRLVNRSAQLQSLILWPVVIVLLVLPEPILHIWLWGRLADAETMIPTIATLIRILALGVAARSVSEGWMRILAGAGEVRKYAPVVLLGALANPFLVIAALLLFPEAFKYTAPAWVFSALLIPIHLIAIPSIVAREFHVTYRQVMSPLVKPALAAVGSFLLCWPLILLRQNSMAILLAFGISFVTCYTLLAFVFVIDRTDRERITAWLMRTSSDSRTGP